MNIREQIEEYELTTLAEGAAKSRESKGRQRAEEPSDIRTDFMRDRDRILHSKAFRRLKNKTQVFLQPEGDHYRTRLTHTLEVSQISRTVAKALRLNEDLVEAISLGHDLGHTPFGHAGERALNELHPEGFRHYEQSLRVVDHIEKKGAGLNLTWEVRDGIVNHQLFTTPATLEGRIVRICDKIAYIHHDMNDAIRGGILSVEEIPVQIREVLGNKPKDWLNTLVHDVILASMERGDICQTAEVGEAMMELREKMFELIYTDSAAKREEIKVSRLIGELYRYFAERPETLPEEYQAFLAEEESLSRVICDYISGMTDQYCIHIFEEIFVPRSWDIL